MATTATTEAPAAGGGAYKGFHHVSFIVGNAMQAASYYVTRLGFKRVAYRGLETGERKRVSHVVAQNRIVFEFVTALNPGDEELARHLAQHGDGAKDVAFLVDDARAIYAQAVARGAKSVREPVEVRDEQGAVLLATIATYGDTVHTFVQNIDYTGAFLPGYKAAEGDDPLERVTGPIGAAFIDHVVGNQADGEMEAVTQWYEKMLGFHRFWSVDDKMIHTEYSSLRSIVVTDRDEAVKMPVNEPANGKRKSQIQEYVDFYGGAGVQHIALNTPNIIETVTRLRERGTAFLDVPPSYYESLREKLKSSPVQVKEDLDVLQKLRILVDYDDKGYLLQIFTKPVEDRPTLFYEFIQRNNHQGFGAGNFKSLFESIEREQAKRGNL